MSEVQKCLFVGISVSSMWEHIEMASRPLLPPFLFPVFLFECNQQVLSKLVFVNIHVFIHY